MEKDPGIDPQCVPSVPNPQHETVQYQVIPEVRAGRKPGRKAMVRILFDEEGEFAIPDSPRRVA